MISYKHRIRGNSCPVSLSLRSHGCGLGQKVESKDLQKLWCSQISKKRGGNFTVKLRNTILPELQNKCDAQVVFLNLTTIWSTNNMNNDKCIGSPYKVIQCPVSLNCRFCLNPKVIQIALVVSLQHMTSQDSSLFPILFVNTCHIRALVLVCRK